MRVIKVFAQNYKGFRNMDLLPDGKSVVIFGENGAGKSSILSAINYLSWGWLNRLNPAQGNAFKSLSSDLVHIDSSTLSLNMVINIGECEFPLSKSYRKQSPGKGAAVKSEKKKYDEFVNYFMEVYGAEEKDIPVFINYGTNRSVINVPLQIRDKHQFSKWAALERAIENELDFKTFFEWFRNQEDYENELARDIGDIEYTDNTLQCVRHAIESMMSGFQNLKVRRNPLRMTVEKHGAEYNIAQLSDGEKCTLGLFGGIARRLALANPNKKNPLEGDGVVMIDEIELHMHPSWQRQILNILHNTFPNIQFIITTHSPQVLGEVGEAYKCLLCSNSDKSEISLVEMGRMDGYDSNYILEEYMHTDSSSAFIQNLLSDAYRTISNNEFNEAEVLIDNIREIVGLNHKSVIELEGAFKRGKILYEKNRQG